MGEVLAGRVVLDTSAHARHTPIQIREPLVETLLVLFDKLLPLVDPLLVLFDTLLEARGLL